MRLTRAQLDARNQIDGLAGTQLTPPELTERVMVAFTTALPNDGYRLFGIDPTTLLINRLFTATDNDDWARHEWLRDIYLAADRLAYIELPTLMRLQMPVVANQERQEECWGIHPDILRQLDPREHSRAFHDLASPTGGTILACFAARGEWVAALQLYRRDPKRPFRRADVEFVRRIGNRIGTLIDEALLRERVLASVTAPASTEASSGVVLVEPDGSLRFASPQATEWIDRIRAADRERAGVTELPTVVASAIAGLRASGAASSVVTQTCGVDMRIEATTAGPDGGAAIVIRPERPAAPPPPPRTWPLTAQERAVSVHLLAGRSNAEIAAALFVSENTVQTHLRNIYGKLEVTSRTQLLARYFREVFGAIYS